MKKTLSILVVFVLVIGVYYAYFHKKIDPDLKSIEFIHIVKWKPNGLGDADKEYTEKDKDNISDVLSALKDRSREKNTEAQNSYNYLIDMYVKDKNDDSVRHRYAIWIFKDSVTITIPVISDKAYKLDSESAKKIIDYLNGINYANY